jgi:hypothetical protein
MDAHRGWRRSERATLPPSQEELLAAVALGIQAMIQQKQNPAKDFKPSGATTAGTEILDELRAVDAIVAEKATPEETEAFRDWLIATAQAAARRGEGGADSWASAPNGSARASKRCSIRSEALSDGAERTRSRSDPPYRARPATPMMDASRWMNSKRSRATWNRRSASGSAKACGSPLLLSRRSGGARTISPQT